ncbi:MAG: hypothetical protein MJ252_06650 [archaeon]|nr:hypothetical protein [archaeon]
MNTFIRVHPKIYPGTKNISRDVSKENTKYSQKIVLPKGVLRDSNGFSKLNTSVNSFNCPFKEPLSKNTKRTTDLIHKVEEKKRLIHKPLAQKNEMKIQKFLDKINAKGKIKPQPILVKNPKVISLNTEENNENINKLNISKLNSIASRTITEQEISLKEQIKKVNEQIKIYESNMNKISNGNQKEIHHKRNLIYIKEDTPSKDTSIIIEKVKSIEIKEISPLKEKSPLKNPQLCEEYKDDIWETIKSEENKFLPNPNYMQKIQTDITERMRLILLDWILEVHLKFRLRPETYYLCINIIDRYLSLKSINRQYLQLLGVTALFIACKYEEIYAPELKDLVFMTDNAYRKVELIQMENKIMKLLKFDLTINSPLKYLDFFLIEMGIEKCQKIIYFTHFLCELSFIYYELIKFNPCLRAAACLYISSIIYGNFEDNIYERLFKKSGYSKEDIVSCAKEILLALEKMNGCKYNSVVKKYQLPKFMNVMNDKMFDKKDKFIYYDKIINK